MKLTLGLVGAGFVVTANASDGGHVFDTITTIQSRLCDYQHYQWLYLTRARVQCWLTPSAPDGNLRHNDNYRFHSQQEPFYPEEDIPTEILHLQKAKKAGRCADFTRFPRFVGVMIKNRHIFRRREHESKKQVQR